MSIDVAKAPRGQEVSVGRKPTVLLAGGGSGGHIFPNLAVIERLREAGVDVEPRLMVSDRPLDAQIARDVSVACTALPVQPLTMRPWRWPSFFAAWTASKKATGALIGGGRVAAVVATGGFVSGPVVAAAQRAGIATALVNLDAVPGRANRLLARRATRLFSAYEVPGWRGAQRIDMPVRRGAIGPDDSCEARRGLGLEPRRPLVLVCGGSQGAQSINRLMAALVGQAPVRAALADWQVLHLAGPEHEGELLTAYGEAKVRARVIGFCQRMDLAWAGAELALSRAGANSVAEAWANRTPTIFLPYPYHKDEHQRLNAKPLVDLGAAILYRDLIEPSANARQLAEPLVALLSNAEWRRGMVEVMRQHPLSDGAQTVAEWVTEKIRPRS